MNLSKILSRRALLLAVPTGCAVFLVLLSYFIPKSSIQNDSASLTAHAAAFNEQAKVNSGLPVRLKIPKINVDAAVDYVGFTSDGAMGVPRGPSDVAWFNLGPRPGENGSAVIDGHEGWKDGTPAVFDNLHQLQKGDKVSVEDEQGAITTFVVREVQIYGKNQDFSDVFRSSDGKAHLNLITCAGVWNAAQKSYSNRLVVFADRE